MAAPPSMEPKLRWLDALRGLGACWVVAFHLNKSGGFAGTPYQSVVDVGWLGVVIFFVVSGLCIQMTAQKAPGVTDFAWRRVWRIYPTYLASLALTAVVIAARQALGGGGLTALPHDLGGWLAHLALAFAPTTGVEGINWVYWSLTCEVAYYAVIALTVWLRPLKWPVLLGLTAVACLAGGDLQGVLFPLRFWSFFAAGAALGELRARPGPWPALLAGLAGLDIALHQSPLLIATGAAALLTAGACLTGWGAFLNRERLFSWIGQWSYSLYLIHVPVGVWIGLSAARAVFGPGFRHQSLAAHVADDLGLFVFTGAVAWLFWRLVERPSIAMMKRAPRPRATPAPAARPAPSAA